MAGTMILDNDQETLVSLTNFVDQLPSVMNQVLDCIYISSRDCINMQIYFFCGSQIMPVHVCVKICLNQSCHAYAT